MKSKKKMMKGQIITVYAKTITGHTISTEIGRENTTYDLKVILGEKIDPPMNPATFRLIHNGQTLKLTDQLQHFDVQNGAILMLVGKFSHVCNNSCRQPGGHPPPYRIDPEL